MAKPMQKIQKERLDLDQYVHCWRCAERTEAHLADIATDSLCCMECKRHIGEHVHMTGSDVNGEYIPVFTRLCCFCNFLNGYDSNYKHGFCREITSELFG